MLPTLALAATALAVASAAEAQTAPLEPERCPRLVAAAPPPVVRVSTVVPVQAEESEVRLTYIGHSTFLIESPAGVTIATDYNDQVRPPETPRIATMNRAHQTHFSVLPDPDIEYLLRGWGENGQPAHYDLTVDDVWLRNVTTNIRSGYGDVLRDQNSIFVFEVAGLCIAHLGHLHHRLTDDHLDALGRIDVVLVPVDGGYTLNIDDMIATLADIQAPLIIPMHYFSIGNLNRFADRLGEHYAVEVNDGPSVTLSRSSLPREPTMLILAPLY